MENWEEGLKSREGSASPPGSNGMGEEENGCGGGGGGGGGGKKSIRRITSRKGEPSFGKLLTSPITAGIASKQKWTIPADCFGWEIGSFPEYSF
ncbi:hypothetical protein ACOMHN_032829 [Nucella lapillus]